jgi:putative exosortase-associated protein (TIGR04073 family)
MGLVLSVLALAVVAPVARAQIGSSSQPGRGGPFDAVLAIRGRITDVRLNAEPPRIEIAAQDGERVQFQLDPNQTQVRHNGQTLEPEALRVGQMVEIDHTPMGNQALAETIDIVDAGDADTAGQAGVRDTGVDADRSAVELAPVTRINPALNEPAGERVLTEEYRAGDKLVRGLANFFTGFIEIPRNINNTTQQENMLTGWTVGLAKGLGYTALRMGTGFYETITFPFPLPAEYQPIVLPEFVWQAEGPDYL